MHGRPWSGRLAVMLCGLFALSTAAAALAADGWTPRPESARFQRLGTAEGLSQSTVMAIVQDPQERIWIGTQAGLNRFDGYDVTVFRPAAGPAPALSDNFVVAMAVDGAGSLWVATLDGLNRIDPATGAVAIHRHSPEHRDSLPSSRLAALHVAADGTLWIGSERGLSRWRPGDDGFDTWSRAAGDGDALPDDRVTALAGDGSGRVLVGTAAGLARFDPGTGRFERIAPPALDGTEISALVVDRQQRLWVGTDGQGLQMQAADGQWRRIGEAGAAQGGLGTAEVRSLLQDRSGRLWAGTDLGLSMLADPDQPGASFVHFRHHRHNPDGIGGGRVAALFEDRAGSLWVGSWNNGVRWLSRERNRFESFTPDQPVLAGMRNPSSITLAPVGDTLWVGSGQGLYRFDTVARTLAASGPPADTTTFFGSAVVDDERWFGTNRGIRQVAAAGDDWRDVVLPEPLPGTRIRRLLVDPARVWLAADPHGLALLDRSLQTLQTLHPVSRSITFIERLDDRVRLVGAYDGLYWFDAASGALLHVHRLLDDSRTPHGLGAAPMAFARSRDGRLWLATNGAGLREIVPGADGSPASARFVAHAGEGLRDPAMKSMRIDARGILWISTASGIDAFDPGSGRSRHFERADGTLGHDYINGSAARFDDGRIAFGAMDGFTLFDPQALQLDPPPPPPAPLLTGLELNGRPAGVALPPTGSSAGARPLALRAGTARSLALRFASPDFVGAQTVRYQYRLDGFDAGWVEVASSRRVAPYTNLEPGDYRFRVRAAQAGGGFGEPTTLALAIEPFWWQTAWARALALLSFAGLLALAYHLRLRRAATMQARLTRQVAERTAALEQAKTDAEQALRQLESTQQELVRSEKMAALGQLVAGVAHEVNTPLGVALTASSYVDDAAGRIVAAVERGELKRSELNGFLDSVRQSNTMIQRNLDRAAQLIANFKQVSVDRSSDGRREFLLDEYLAELLQSLQLMWKHRSITIDVDCPAGIVLDSFPGALGQVVTNLLQNAVRHGFPGDRGGTVRLAIRRIDEQRIELRVSDDGVGIPPDHLGRIFDPFFTTRRNQGGTGLGLHIVYNLVTQKLGGMIAVDSPPGRGTTFVLALPLVAP